MEVLEKILNLIQYLVFISLALLLAIFFARVIYLTFVRGFNLWQRKKLNKWLNFIIEL